MPTCASCGAGNREGARFCDACGSPLAAAPPPTEQRKTVTVLFCDVTGSTALGERLDPESLRRVMGRYFDAARVVVERHGGTVEKFIGDAVMAVFGVPTVHEDDALRAVRAASDLRQALRGLNEELERDYGTTLELRIGVNTGQVVTGTEERLATGDAVNVAARLEQAARPGEVLLGSETVRLVRDAVEAEPVEALALKGKADPVPAYRLVAVVGEAPSRRLDTPMVGRERERRLLADAWERACSERACQLFTVLGPAGVGKSRLATEFLRSLDGANVARGRCVSYGEGITYWPVVEVLKQLGVPGHAELDPRARAALLGVLEQEGGQPASTEEIAWAFRKLLEAQAAARPVVCVLDDLQWAESTLLDLVEHVADLSRGAPILLLCLARPELLDLRSTWGGGKLNATTVLLEPLGDSETDTLIEHLLGGEELEPGLRDRIRTAAGGNPLFVEEMLAMVHESGDGAVVVPPTIQALLAARLDQLPGEERDVLSRGSVEGQLFHQGSVEALGPGEAEVATCLTRLVRKELVRPDQPIFPGDDAFRFRHILIRDAAYDALPKATRAELHERFAVWLEEHAADLVEADEILGYHLEQAYRYRAELGPVDDRGRDVAARAGRRLVAASRRASERNDLRAAVSLLGRALELLPEEERSTGLRISRAMQTFWAGRPAEGLSIAEDAVERAREAGDRIAELRARLQAAWIRLYIDPEGAPDRIRMLVEEALPEFEAAGDEAALADAWWMIQVAEQHQCRYAAAARAGERALEYRRRVSDRNTVRWTLFAVANSHCFGPTPVDDVLTFLDRHAAEYELERWPHLRQLRATLEAMRGDFEAARELEREALEQTRELGHRLGEGYIALGRCEVAALVGDAAEAEREARRGCELLEAVGERSVRSTLAAALALALCALGREGEAEQWADVALELGGADDVSTQMLCRRARAKVLGRRGDHLEAERVAREAVALAEKTDMLNEQGHALADLAEVLLLVGRNDEAAEALEQALALYERKGNVVMAGRTRERLADLAETASR